MKRLLHLYPRATRDRYGEEISLLLEESPHPVRDGLNVFWHALLDRTESTMTLTWRRLPRFLLAGLAWLVGGYLAFYWMDRARIALIPTIGVDDTTRLRLLTFGGVLLASAVAMLAGRLWRRSPVWMLAAAISLVHCVFGVLVIDVLPFPRRPYIAAYLNWLWLAVLYEVVWIAFVALVVLAIRRRPAAGHWIALAGGLAAAYATSVVNGLIGSAVFETADNPWTVYWTSVTGSPWIVLRDGVMSMGIDTSAWWMTVATALVLGCALARYARRPALPEPQTGTPSVT
jgi:hypothetical protein